MPTLVLWAVLALLLFARGLLASIEAALQAVSAPRVKALAQGSRRGARLQRLKLDPEASAAALRSGMVLSGFTAAAIGTLVPPRLLNVSLAAVLESGVLVFATPIASALLVALLATVVDVVFRSLALRDPESWALGTSGLASTTVTLLYPLVRVMVAPVTLALRAFGLRPSFQPPPPPLEDLEKLLQLEAQRQEIDKSAPQLIRGIFEMSEKTVSDVMVPRTGVVALEISTPVERILQIVAEESHSRIPVYREDVDHIVGVLHVRDVVPLLLHPELIVLQDLLRPAVYVPWLKPIGDLLREMQRHRIHLAIVVDEYGGFSGIVTLEDILREIVGDIGDEFEAVKTPYVRQLDDSYLVQANATRAEFEKAFDFRFPADGDFDTVGGFLSSLAGRMPEVGDRFTVNGFTFIITEKEGPRLHTIRVLKPKPIAPPMVTPQPPRPRPSAPGG